jgi:pilus assembly protein Flp/PilA
MMISSMLRRHFTRLTRAFAADEGGATAVEYAITASGISIAIAATVWAIGPKLVGIFTNVSNGFLAPQRLASRQLKCPWCRARRQAAHARYQA